MATTAVTIPRFLLPQLTWETNVAQSLPPLFPISKAVVPQATPRLPPSSTLSQVQRRKRQNAIRTSIPSIYPKPSICTFQHVTPPRASSFRQFHTTPTLLRDHHFDTLKFVQRLREEGFSEEQATAMMRVLSDVIEESIQNLTRTMVLREGLSIASLITLPFSDTASLSTFLTPWL